MDWYEQLPPLCPPTDANPCNGRYYRIAKGNPANDSDFFSQRKLQPDKVFVGPGVDECIAHAKTFSDSHFSWWRSNDFDVSQTKVVKI